MEGLEKQLEQHLHDADLEKRNVELEKQLGISLQAEARMNDMSQKLKAQLDDLIKNFAPIETA